MDDFDSLWQAANEGDATAQLNLARHYQEDADYGRSRRWFSRAARAGQLDADVELGRQSLLGQGQAASVSDALSAFSRAAEGGNAQGQFELACMIYRGQGIDRDTLGPATLLTAAARQGLPVALLNYALICEAQDPALCQSLLLAAAAGGELRAMALSGLQQPPAMPQSLSLLALEELQLTEPDARQAEIPDPACSLKIFPGLLSALECAYVRETARPDLLPSHTVHPVTGESVQDETRSSYGWSFHPSQEDIAITRVKERLACQAGLPFAHAEPFAILRYLPGQQYREHFDFIDPQAGEAGQEIGHRGQRLATTFSYLSDVNEGGETTFPRFGQTVKPQAGKAVYFRNTLADGSIDRNSLHASLPVVKGEKWLATLWFRDRPFVA